MEAGPDAPSAKKGEYSSLRLAEFVSVAESPVGRDERSEVPQVSWAAKTWMLSSLVTRAHRVAEQLALHADHPFAPARERDRYGRQPVEADSGPPVDAKLPIFAGGGDGSEPLPVRLPLGD